ncbi:hypothetical protein OHA33_30965 [Streptomyces sp. NBC_00562]|uniref:hypothetical protein n=1 Tax=Streptomyces sp. NBC_00562 TaxID=2975777 RepID=UPI002E80468E|nr:hypothetical protein [Streptomyces sp. NBC_00562]WUC22939.1 hypothetical protein OHA33_30965 [Streptomyces sp. NBC_00562]
MYGQLAYAYREFVRRSGPACFDGAERTIEVIETLNSVIAMDQLSVCVLETSLP